MTDHIARDRLEQLINEYRYESGLSTLYPHGGLRAIAEVRATTEAREADGVLDHEGARAAQFYAGYPWGAGEVLAGRQATPEEALAAWQQSSGHNDALLARWATEIGAAVVAPEDARISPVWCVQLGARAAWQCPVLPMVVRDGEEVKE